MGNRNTWRRDGDLIPVNVTGGMRIYAGNVVLLDEGMATNLYPQAYMVVIGVADETVDNLSGGDGDKQLMVRRNADFYLVNDTAAPVTQADVGRDCYLLDPVTVTRSSTSLPVAGRVVGLDSSGVWVRIGG